MQQIIGNILLISCIPLVLVIYVMMYEVLLDIRDRRKNRKGK